MEKQNELKEEEKKNDQSKNWDETSGETILIAEATEKSDYPSINIYHKDAVGEVDEVVFAEYNPEKETGRKLMAAA